MTKYGNVQSWRSNVNESRKKLYKLKLKTLKESLEEKSTRVGSIISIRFIVLIVWKLLLFESVESY